MATTSTLQLRQRAKVFKSMFRNKKAVVGAVILIMFALGAIFAPFLTPYEPQRQNIRNRLQGPSSEHWLGTDQFGRDIMTRILYGGRLSLRVGFTSVGIALAIGGTMGMIAGYYGGFIDNLFMRFVDVLLALPGFLLALAIVASLGPGLENVIIAIGIANIPAFARMMRSSVLTVKELDYVAASVAVGCSDYRILLKHVLPNAINPIIVLATLGLAGAILAAAGLSFLGMGAQPPTPEWGSMIATARPFIRVAHYPVTFPGLAIFLTVLSLNMVGDGLRDALDPRSTHTM